MNDLVKMVAEKSNISEEQARTAVETVTGFLKENLPSPLDNQVEKVLQGDTADLTGEAKEALKGLFGSK